MDNHKSVTMQAHDEPKITWLENEGEEPPRLKNKDDNKTIKSSAKWQTPVGAENNKSADVRQLQANTLKETPK